MAKTIPVSIVIPTLNRPQALLRTLETIAAGDAVPDQLLIVDQSNDETFGKNADMLTQTDAAASSFLHLKLSPPSTTAARNLGMQKAINNILLFCDDDVDFHSDTLSRLYENMKITDTALVAAVDEGLKKHQSVLGYLTGMRSFKNRKIGHVTRSVLGRYPDDVSGKVETNWAMGFFFAVKKSLPEKYGIVWDEKLTGYAYAEDLDFTLGYCNAAKAEGKSCYIDGDIKILHRASGEYRIQTESHIRRYVINRMYIAAKHKIPGAKSAMAWCDFWMRIRYLIKRRPEYRFLKKAQRYAKAHQAEIESGTLNYEI
ncbi:MAG TPA: glycosyltransferase [Oscillospiraceae bacterium]|nr:glycosyltransferase [Oscillospiraceae bacterium]HPF56359.1 glycosyltransferase [Clostridiales bacterium]HPK34671.1 glycosyltransferase [Oscillospiraceae bacterium]HPR74565.1 glycosyltransferase [Oscillospiraceae bacterium]